jgi:5-deoxy-glucuronate isomerase
MNEWYRPAGSAGRKGYDVAIGPREADWEHTGLYVATLEPGSSRVIIGGEFEWLILPLSGQVKVECAGQLISLSGRPGPFEGPTDFAYVPVSSTFWIASTDGARVALPHAKASKVLPFRRIPADETVVELRGAGSCSRQVNNLGTPGVLEADSLIACEVLTPAGNWSSYPPHKHDEDREDLECALEEIYYFEMRAEEGAPREAKPFGYQRVYGTKDRPIDVQAEVRSGDVVLVPHGWHGPSMAAPGYDMYYLNVMAGPGTRRQWLISDDPDHAWIRRSWATQKVDPRLPFGGYQ